MGANLDAKIEAWKASLIDLGMRNRLINFKEGKRSSVEITEPSCADLYNRVVVDEDEIKFPYATKVTVNEDGEEAYENVRKGDVECSKGLIDLQKSLKNIRAKAKIAQEEQGINTLFLAFGMLSWKESESSSLTVQAPIVLVPVKLTIESFTSPYKLALHDDEIVVNPTLYQKLLREYGITLPDFDSDEGAILDYLDEVEDIVSKRDWTVERRVFLTNLSFLKINMYRDLDKNLRKLVTNAVISGLAGEESTVYDAVPEELCNYDHDKTRPIDLFQVVDADSSQQDAVLLSKKGVSFVLQGPPGTGKSQTITNIIAEALADGKKVLFVSEKMAALQVVHKRLASVGLADFCLTLHSHKANKKEVLNELDRSLSPDRRKVRDEVLGELWKLEQERAVLNAYCSELHTPCSALGRSIYDVYGSLAKLDNVPSLMFPIPQPDAVTFEQLQERRRLIDEFTRVLGKKTEDYKNNVWYGAKLDSLSYEMRHDIAYNVDVVVPVLEELNARIEPYLAQMQSPALKPKMTGIERWLDILSVAKNSPMIPTQWIFDANIDELLTLAKKFEGIASEIIGNREDLGRLYDTGVFEVDGEAVSNRLKTIEQELRFYLRFDGNKDLRKQAEAHLLQLTSLLDNLEALNNEVKRISAVLGLRAPSKFSEIQQRINLVSGLFQLQNIHPTSDWFKPDVLSSIRQGLNKHVALHKEMADLQGYITQSYDKELFTVDFYSLLQRFRSEYTGFFKRMSAKYRGDIRLLSGFSVSGKKLKYREALALLTELKKVNDVQEQINSYRNYYLSAYGKYYEGINTEWNALERDLERFSSVVSGLVSLPDSLKSVLLSGTLPIEDIVKGKALFEKVGLKETLEGLHGLLVADITGLDYAEAVRLIRRLQELLAEFMDRFSVLNNLRKEKTSYATILTDYNRLGAIQVNERAFENADKKLAKGFEWYYQGISTNWGGLIYALEFAKQWKKLAVDYGMDSKFVAAVCSDAAMVEKCGRDEVESRRLWEKIRAPYAWFTDLFAESDLFGHMFLLDLRDRMKACKDKLNLLEEWIDYRVNRAKLTEAGLDGFISVAEDSGVAPNLWVDAYNKRFFGLWVDAVMPQFRTVASFKGDLHEERVKSFRRLDALQFEIARARIRDLVMRNIPDGDSFLSAHGEVAILKRELGKRRKIMPLRKLFKEIPNLITTLRPCFMMSPLSVSVFLEADSYQFDMVIFDEASQVHTEDAVGAIMRGKQAIIVGDTNQLPPTNFFATSLNDEDYDTDSEEEEGASEIGVYESILDEAASVLPQRSLQWHYRSKNEGLIAFSNAKIYRNQLITFPSATEGAEDAGVEYVYVEDGVYDRSGKRNNVIEARKVADLVFEHFQKNSKRSLGVVTFSEAQQSAVEAALRQRRSVDSSFEQYFNEDREEPFFVKNLENVQGDERDTIIFSIGYARDQKGTMTMHFGPLNRDGGQRRLNVAITRAKENVKLVGSIKATDIDLSKTHSEGVALLRSYISYAEHGIAALDREITHNETLGCESPFEESVYDFLKLKGYDVEAQVGCSSYRIDMAVKHPKLSGTYVLGIECDGATYHSSRTARERDRLRQEVLESMGWKIYRIWSTDWIKSPASEKEKLLEAVERALFGANSGGADEAATSTGKAGAHKAQISLWEESAADEVKAETPTALDLTESVRQESSDVLDEFDLYMKVDAFRIFMQCYDEKKTLQRVLEAEAPLHIEEFCRRVAPIYGKQKATSNMVTQIWQRLLQLFGTSVTVRNNFVWLNGFELQKPRKPDENDGDVRQIEYICEEELLLSLKAVVKHSFGIAPEDLFTETARILGYKRTGGTISATLTKIYKKALKNGVFEEVDGKARIVG